MVYILERSVRLHYIVQVYLSYTRHILLYKRITTGGDSRLRSAIPTYIIPIMTGMSVLGQFYMISGTRHNALSSDKTKFVQMLGVLLALLLTMISLNTPTAASATRPLIENKTPERTYIKWVTSGITEIWPRNITDRGYER